MAYKAQDVTGERVGLLKAEVALGRRESSPGRIKPFWLWRCDCGGAVESDIASIRGGRVRHCGCQSTTMKRLRHGHAVHGKISPTYTAYQHAKSRCHNPQDKRYAAYGGRGIRMNDEWASSYLAFLRDMGERPSGKSLERRDVDGDYSAENCVWATPSEQSNNTQSTVWVEVDGKRVSLKQYARGIGVNYKALHYRVRAKGQDVSAAAHALLFRPRSRIP